MVPFRLLLISRDALIAHAAGEDGPEIHRLLAALHRRGIPLLLTAPAPDHWMPTVGDADTALGLQREIQHAAWEAGGEMDGVYYVPRSLLTQDRNRVGALKDILERYHVEAAETALISNSRPFLNAAEAVGIPNFFVSASPEEQPDLVSRLTEASGLE